MMPPIFTVEIVFLPLRRVYCRLFDKVTAIVLTDLLLDIFLCLSFEGDLTGVDLLRGGYVIITCLNSG